MHRLADLLLSRDPVQRARLTQALLAMCMMGAGVVGMHYFVWQGMAPGGAVWIWSVFSVAGMVAAFAAIRSGWSRRFADPSLTVPQMVYALTSGAVAYGLVGAGRGGVFPIVMVILMFGMFIVTPRQMALVSLYAVVLFGLTMAVMAATRPEVYVPAIEIGHFIMVATMVPSVSILAMRLARLRQRSRQQRAELQTALARIRELATRDELTGLINRRHLLELMEQEHQRCIRSGHSFCVAAMQIDGFAALATERGERAGEDLLRAVAVEGLRYVRVADVLARWGEARFVLLMSDTRVTLARGGLDRLRERMAEARVLPGDDTLRITLSAGLAEHHAGETVAQTLARAEAALQEALGQGRNRLLLG
jgi:diguanylate cyclase (GGDEF)-like protein